MTTFKVTAIVRSRAFGRKPSTGIRRFEVQAATAGEAENMIRTRLVWSGRHCDSVKAVAA